MRRSDEGCSATPQSGSFYDAIMTGSPMHVAVGRIVWRLLRGGRCFCVGVLLLCWAALAGAEVAGVAEGEPLQLQETMSRLEQELREDGPDVRRLEAMTAELTRFTGQGSSCVEATTKNLEELLRFVAALGEPLAEEPEHLTAVRGKVQEEQRRLESRLAECRLVSLRATELATRVSTEWQRLRTRDLHTRGEALPQTALRLLREGVPRERLERSLTQVRDSLSSWRAGLVVLITICAAWLGSALSRRVVASSSATIQVGLRLVLPGLLALIAALGAGWLLWDRLDSPPSLSTRLVAAVVLIAGLLAGAGRLRRLRPDLTVARLPLLLCCLLLAVVFCTVSVPPAELEVSIALRFVRGLAIGFFCLVALWLERSFCPGRGGGLRRGARWLLTCILAAILLAEWSGFRDLAAFMLGALGGSLLSLLLVSVINHVLPPVLNGLAQGTTPWQCRLRQLLGIEENTVVSGLIWLGWLLRLVLWLVWLLSLFWFWDAGGEWSRRALELYHQGFSLGSMHITPGRIVLGLLVFSLGWSLLVFLRQQFVRRGWREQADLEPGALETLGTIAGYAGHGLVLFLSLLVAGINFTGLAVVAGALSVGIGFGLQNIVNNFISGLILLFERPVKRGDWIKVGNAEGIVKRISVRSTVIQTFENADIIVPNSEFISSQVTNMMFDDRRGRLRVPVGVAYGSDTALVERLLLEVAGRHAEVVVGGSLPEPWVLFLRFGESSLDFELNCYLRNINIRARVASDLLYAIDRAFREHGIEIPFPQRDLRIREMPAAPPG